MNGPPTILIVEDDSRIAAIEADYLRHAGFSVVLSDNGENALDRVRDQPPALIVLDLKLPRMDGIDVARALRRSSQVPIIMVTARVEEADRLRGLEVGADDYLTKPFSPRELVARVRAVLRRSTAARPPDRVHLGDVIIDVPSMTVTKSGQPIDLTTTEFRLLSVMAQRPGRVFTRAQLLDAVQGESVEALDRAIDAHVKNIRRKLETDPRAPRYLLTVYGVGYKCSDA
jgi:two-component system alkaline phosphatase synthesis response regulator PhoP